MKIENINSAGFKEGLAELIATIYEDWNEGTENNKVIEPIVTDAACKVSAKSKVHENDVDFIADKMFMSGVLYGMNEILSLMNENKKIPIQELEEELKKYISI